MSVIPLILNNAIDDFLRPNWSGNSDFEFGFFSDDFVRPRALVQVPRARCCRPYRRPRRPDGDAAIATTNDGEFKACINVQEYQPENLTVKVIDNTVTIEGKHEERKDEQGFVSRQFTRRYVLPEDVDTSNVVSRLSSDGVLSITAPKKAAALPPNGRIIPIQHASQESKTSSEQDKPMEE